MNYNKVIKDLKERNDKLQEQYRLRDIRCIHLEYENEMLKSDFEAQHELTKKYAEESKELNQKYLNAVADYETTMSELQKLKKENKILRKNAENNDKVVDKVNWENQLLKKQLEEYKEQINKGLYNTCLPYTTGYNKAIKDKENQQKEFIDYMNKTIEELECDDVDDEEMKAYLIQRINTFKEILQKYKDIIGDDK